MSPGVAMDLAFLMAPARSPQSWAGAAGFVVAARMYFAISGPFSPTQRTALARAARAAHIGSRGRAFWRPPTIWITLPGGQASRAATAASGMVAIESW